MIFCSAGLLLWTDDPNPPFPKELTHFEPQGQVVFEGAAGQWDQRVRERGWILKEHDGFKLWYTGYKGARSDRKFLGLATSLDGRQWKRAEQNPLIRDHWVEDGMVVRDGARYHLFAEGINDQAHSFTSFDGVQWQREGPLDVRLASGEKIPPGPYGTPTVWLEDGVWHLFYERRDAGIWLATSKDRKVWTNVSDSPVLTPGPGGPDARLIALNQIIKHHGVYYGVYHGIASAGDSQWTTCLAASFDLRRWKKYAKNPLAAGDRSSGQFVKEKDDWVLYTMHPVVRRHAPVK